MSDPRRLRRFWQAALAELSGGGERRAVEATAGRQSRSAESSVERHSQPLEAMDEDRRSAHRAREAYWVSHFGDSSLESRRLFAEVLGTFMLVLAGAGAGVVGAVSHGQIGRVAAVSAPGLTVLAVILSMGAVSGAHLNPTVSIAFAARGDFPWRRVPGYVVAQLLGATLAVLFLLAVFGRVGELGATAPGAGVDAVQAVLVELVLTAGLVTTILGTASRAQNLGPISAFGVAGYIILAGLWASPISGASMNPARSFAPELVLGNFSELWIYLTGPLAGTLVAVGIGYVLRGAPGHDPHASEAAQGSSEAEPLS